MNAKLTLHTASGEAVECEIPTDCQYFQFDHDGNALFSVDEDDWRQVQHAPVFWLPIIAAVAACFYHEKRKMLEDVALGIAESGKGITRFNTPKLDAALNEAARCELCESAWRKLTARPLTAKPEAKK